MKSFADLQDLINDVDALTICKGGPDYTKSVAFQNITAHCAYKDTCGRWRHNRCSLVVLEGVEACKFCVSSHKTLGNHLYMKKERAQRVRCPVNVTPRSAKKKIDIHAKARCKQNRSIQNLKEQVKKYKDEVKNLRREMKEVDEKKFYEQLNEKVTDHTQVKLISNFNW